MRPEFDAAHAQVMRQVLNDRDRSVERAVELGIEAGIAIERDRMRRALDLRGPPARGIEKIVVVMALEGSRIEDIKSTVEFFSNHYEPEALARSRRAEFRVVEGTSKRGERRSAG